MKKFLIFFAGILMILTIIFFSKPLFFLNMFSPWKTQSVIYIHKENKKRTIEFQMKDIGALGYKKRIVEVNKGILFNSEAKVDTSKIVSKNWKRVDTNVNQLGLKGG